MADSDLADLRKQCITSLYLCTDNVLKYLDNEKDAEFTKLKSYVQEYCLMEAQQEVAIQALERTKRETDASNVETLKDRFETNLSSLTGKRLNVSNHPYMLELKKRYDRSQQRTQNNLDESDLAITESQDQYIDPITKRPIQNPVRNTMCGHIYEQESIINLINMRNRVKCPVVGCGNREAVQKEHLVGDDELRFRMTITQHSTLLHERSTMDLDTSAD